MDGGSRRGQRGGHARSAASPSRGGGGTHRGTSRGGWRGKGARDIRGRAAGAHKPPATTAGPKAPVAASSKPAASGASQAASSLSNSVFVATESTLKLVDVLSSVRLSRPVVPSSQSSDTPSLPADMLCVIFSSFSVAFRVRVLSRVSKSWRAAALRSITAYKAWQDRLGSSAEPCDFNHAISLLPSLTKLNLRLYEKSCLAIRLPPTLVSLEVAEYGRRLLYFASPLPSGLTHLSLLSTDFIGTGALVTASVSSLISLQLRARTRHAPDRLLTRPLATVHYPSLRQLYLSIDALMPPYSFDENAKDDGLCTMLARHASQLTSLVLHSHHTVSMPSELIQVLVEADLSALRHFTVLGVSTYDPHLLVHLPPQATLTLSGMKKPLKPELIPLISAKLTCLDLIWQDYFTNLLDQNAYTNLSHLTCVKRLGLYKDKEQFNYVVNNIIKPGRAALVISAHFDRPDPTVFHLVLRYCPNLTCIAFSNTFDWTGTAPPVPFPDVSLPKVTKVRFRRENKFVLFFELLRETLRVCPNVVNIVADSVPKLDMASLAAVLAQHRHVQFVRIGVPDLEERAEEARKIEAALPVRVSVFEVLKST